MKCNGFNDAVERAMDLVGMNGVTRSFIWQEADVWYAGTVSPCFRPYVEVSSDGTAKMIESLL